MAKPTIPEATQPYIKFASTHLLRGALAFLRTQPQPDVLLKQAKENLPKLQDQATTRVIAEHEFARLVAHG